MIVYKTTNKINGKSYVGQTITNNPDYLGSGTLIRDDINKYGIESFERITLEECFDKKILNERERYWIKELNTIEPNGYNRSMGTSALINRHNYALRLPIGLSERIEVLAKKQRETPYGWMLRTLWRVSGWDGENTISTNNKQSVIDSSKSDRG